MRRPITLFESILPLLTMLVCLVAGALVLSIGPELLNIVMLIAAAVAGI